MNFNCRSHREDALFVIALLVPALFAGARYIESEHQMTQIAQAQQHTVQVASAKHAPAPVVLAQTQSQGH
jgi:hypothetical protein